MTKRKGEVPKTRKFDGKIYKLGYIASTKAEAEHLAKSLRTDSEKIRVVTYPSSYDTPFGMHPSLHPCGSRAIHLDKKYYCLYERRIAYKTYEEEDRSRLLWQEKWHVPRTRKIDGQMYKLTHIVANKSEATLLAKKFRTPNRRLRVITYPSSYNPPIGMHFKSGSRSDYTYYCLYERNVT